MQVVDTFLGVAGWWSETAGCRLAELESCVCRTAPDSIPAEATMVPSNPENIMEENHELSADQADVAAEVPMANASDDAPRRTASSTRLILFRTALPTTFQRALATTMWSSLCCRPTPETLMLQTSLSPEVEGDADSDGMQQGFWRRRVSGWAKTPAS